MQIEVRSGIRREVLSEEYYFQSLLAEAQRAGELTAEEAENIAAQGIVLLADRIERFTRGQSTSVKTEVAQTILASCLYTVGLHLKSLPSCAAAVAALRSEPLQRLFAEGCKVLHAKVSSARCLYQFVLNTKAQTPMLAYHSTLEGIASFFREYDTQWEAHGAAGSIDYQLMHAVEGLAGVEYMLRYLQNLYVENLFCGKFLPEAIHEVMRGYSEGYADLLGNLFAQVLLNAIGCALCGVEIACLQIDTPELLILNDLFSGADAAEVEYVLNQGIGDVIRTLHITSESMRAYIFACVPEFAARVLLAAETGTMDRVFVRRRR